MPPPPAGFHSTIEYVGLPRAHDAWVVEDLVPAAGMTLIYGKPKTGKSYLAMQLASAIACAETEHWLGFPIMRHGKVAYLQVDTPRTIWAERVEDMIAHGVDFTGVYWADAMDAPYPFNILNPEEGYRWLKQHIAALAPVAVIVDVLREIHGENENDSTMMRNVLAHLRGAVPEAALILVSHSRKGLEGEHGAPDITDENRGSGYVVGRVDCILRLSEKRLEAKGRAIPDVSLAIVRDRETKLIGLADKFHQDGLDLVRARGGTDSERAIAGLLHAKHDRTHTYEACRSHVRRLLRLYHRTAGIS